jgi:7-cyano-7-deazaguanine synthase in queuosine biosynthesis
MGGMKYYRLACYVDENDGYQIDNYDHKVNLFNKTQFKFTFWNPDVFKMTYRLPHFFSDEAIDLFYIANFVYYADKFIKRSQFNDGWTRYIFLSIPVLSYDIWANQTDLLENMLGFLSGDLWKIEFRKRELNLTETKAKEKYIQSSEKKVDCQCISLLSGGLDSFIGAIDLLESGLSTLFVSHFNQGRSLHPIQIDIKTKLASKYNLNYETFYEFNSTPSGGSEPTTRSRSFLFFSYAACISSTFSKSLDLYVPENGLISLNIPLTNSRIGSSSTRTTHPYYMKLFCELLSILNIKVTLKFPYRFKTKGEMILECSNRDFLNEHYSETMSCSHPDNVMYRRLESMHCGTCYPCVIRRAAIKKAGLLDATLYKDDKFQNGLTSKRNLKIYQLALAEFENYTDYELLVLKSGSLYSDTDKYADVYKRGMIELDSLIGDIAEDTKA